MEKLLLKSVFILGLTFSYNALSYTSQTTCADAGTCQTRPGPGGSLGAFVTPTYTGPGYAGSSVGRSPEQIAASEKKITEDKKAYCKANNYPTNVPFCADFKKEEEAKKRCEDAKNYIPIEQAECKADASVFGTNFSVLYCSSETASGVFGSRFTYDGDYFDSATTYPPTSYTTGAQCKQLASAAISYYQSYCSTNGDRQKLAACSGQ